MSKPWFAESSLARTSMLHFAAARLGPRESLDDDQTVADIIDAWSRKLEAHEDYAERVSDALVQTRVSTERLDLIVKLLSHGECLESARSAGVAGPDHVAFLLEAHHMRLSGVFDRVLAVLDTVLCLWNHPKNCTRNNIMQNLMVRSSSAIKPVGRLQSLVDKSRDLRDALTHRRSYSDDDLQMLWHAEVVPASPVERFIEEQGLTLASYVEQRVSELEDTNRKVDRLVLESVDELVDDYTRKYEELKFGASLGRAS